MGIKNKQILKDALGWGAGLWFIGWVLGIVFFMTPLKPVMGWIITPIGSAITLWVLIKKVKADSMIYYLKLAVVWIVIAIVFDYLFNVLLFKIGPAYYKLDIFVYYALIFILPLITGAFKTAKINGKLPFLQEQIEKKKENKQKVMDLLDKQEKITNEEVGMALKVSASTAERYFDELEKEGKIEQVGNTGRSVFYKKS